jgi:hypothetical protein
MSANTGAEDELRRHVGAAVLHALDRIYESVSGRVYKHISGLFNDAAQRQDDHQLDELLKALLAAARLCGANPDVAPHATNQLSLALSVDAKRAHKRRLTEVFPSWPRIRDLGAEIRAHTNPLAEPWQLPAMVRCIDTDRRLREHDPLDDDLPRGWTGSLEGWLDAP